MMEHNRAGLCVLSLALLVAAAVGCASSAPKREVVDTGERIDNAASQRREVTVPSGTVLNVELKQTLSSASSQPGDLFTARVIDAVLVGGKVAIGAGSIVSGRVVDVEPSKKIGGTARLNLEFTSLALASGGTSPISAAIESLGKSQTKKDAATIGGAAAGGAVLGRIIGHQRGDDTEGTAVGAVVGAAVGTAIAASNKGEDVTLAEGTTVGIRLDAPVKVRT